MNSLSHTFLPLLSPDAENRAAASLPNGSLPAAALAAKGQAIVETLNGMLREGKVTPEAFASHADLIAASIRDLNKQLATRTVKIDSESAAAAHVDHNQQLALEVATLATDWIINALKRGRFEDAIRLVEDLNPLLRPYLNDSVPNQDLGVGHLFVLASSLAYMGAGAIEEALLHLRSVSFVDPEIAGLAKDDERARELQRLCCVLADRVFNRAIHRELRGLVHSDSMGPELNLAAVLHQGAVLDVASRICAYVAGVTLDDLRRGDKPGAVVGGTSFVRQLLRDPNRVAQLEPRGGDSGKDRVLAAATAGELVAVASTDKRFGVGCNHSLNSIRRALEKVHGTGAIESQRTQRFVALWESAVLFEGGLHRPAMERLIDLLQAKESPSIADPEFYAALSWLIAYHASLSQHQIKGQSAAQWWFQAEQLYRDAGDPGLAALAAAQPLLHQFHRSGAPFDRPEEVGPDLRIWRTQDRGSAWFLPAPERAFLATARLARVVESRAVDQQDGRWLLQEAQQSAALLESRWRLERSPLSAVNDLLKLLWRASRAHERDLKDAQTIRRCNEQLVRLKTEAFTNAASERVPAWAKLGELYGSGVVDKKFDGISFWSRPIDGPPQFYTGIAETLWAMHGKLPPLPLRFV